MPKPLLPQLQGHNPLSLTGAWLFCEGSGPSAADYVRQTDANLVGALTNGPTWVAGDEGPCLQFDGSDDRVAIPDSTIWDLGSGEFSLAIRVRLASTSQREFVNQRSGNTVGGFEFWMGSNNMMHFNASSSVGILSAAWTPQANRWYDLAFTRTVSGATTTNRLYLDGVQIGTNTAAAVPANVTGEVWVGNYSVGGYAFGGAFDYLMVANRGWTADEVRDLKADPYASFRPRHGARRFIVYPSQTIAPAANRIDLATTSPTLVRGSLARAPSEAALRLSTGAAAPLRGSVAIAPQPATLQAAMSGPVVVRGAVSAGPEPSAIDLVTIAPVVARGSVSIAPASLAVGLAASGLSAVRGSLAIDPETAAVSLAGIAPELVRGAVQVETAAASLESGTSGPAVARGNVSIAPLASGIESGVSGPDTVRGGLTIVPGENRLLLRSTGSGAPEDVTVVPAPAAMRVGTNDPEAVRGGCVLSPVAARLILECSWPGFGDVPCGEVALARSRRRMAAAADREREGSARARRRIALAAERVRYAAARSQPHTGDPEC